MTRLEVLAEVERIIAESVFEAEEQPAEAAERVLTFLDGVGVDMHTETFGACPICLGEVKGFGSV